MTSKILPLTQSELKRVIHYEPTNGVFTRLVTRGNAKRGTIAGTSTTSGHMQMMIHGTLYLLHRLAFLYMTGSFPSDEVDHINHISGDNRWRNLRSATRCDNSRNRTMNNNNTSGHAGVVWNKRNKKWYARIVINSKQIHLGAFNNIENAKAARQTARVTYGFHKNHGLAL